MRIVFSIIALFISGQVVSQQSHQWAPDGKGYFSVKDNDIRFYSLSGGKDSIFLSAGELTPTGATSPIKIKSWTLSESQDQVLIYTNAKKVW
ncbi:hypothetical protein MD537_25110, partial [Flavihumibacter sediminis]|nr:hypothetical protein [Flavihumibacter sediminis]